MVISSKDNKKIKEFISLRNKSFVKNGDLVFVEGEKLCFEALESGVKIEKLLVTENKFPDIREDIIAASEEVIIVKDFIFRNISKTLNPQGIAAIVKSCILKEEEFIEKSFYLKNGKCRLIICENIQDPGNFGSIIRSADAFGFNGVVFTKTNVHPFNSKSLQSSMGSVFHIELVYTENLHDLIIRLKENDIKIYTTHLKGRNIDSKYSFGDRCAVILGNEGSGVSDATVSASDELIKIPMSGKAESLNVSNAAAIICFLAN